MIEEDEWMVCMRDDENVSEFLLFFFLLFHLGCICRTHVIGAASIFVGYFLLL